MCEQQQEQYRTYALHEVQSKYLQGRIPFQQPQQTQVNAARMPQQQHQVQQQVPQQLGPQQQVPQQLVPQQQVPQQLGPQQLGPQQLGPQQQLRMPQQIHYDTYQRMSRAPYPQQQNPNNMQHQDHLLWQKKHLPIPPQMIQHQQQKHQQGMNISCSPLSSQTVLHTVIRSAQSVTSIAPSPQQPSITPVSQISDSRYDVPMIVPTLPIHSGNTDIASSDGNKMEKLTE